MENIVCSTKHINLKTLTNGREYFGGIDLDGYELPNVELTETDRTESFRLYNCTNCYKQFNGEETFKEVKNHFGNIRQNML